MSTLLLNNTPITYELKVDKRRSTVLFTLQNNKIIITAPALLSQHQAAALLRNHTDWILKTLAVKVADSEPNLLVGTKFPYLGFYKTLHLEPNTNHNKLSVTNDAFIIAHTYPLDSAAIRLILKRWYVHSAGKLLAVKTAFWAKKIGVSPNRIIIKEQKTRWGSCSSLGNINYNWRIIMAPENIIDYLVIHELCHLQHMNHSANFWQLVADYSPNYMDCKNWLKTNGTKLTLG